MSNLQLVKGAVHIVTALGVSKVLTDVIKNNTTVVTTADQILVTSGSLVIGSMVGEQASNHVSKVMYRITERFNKD